MMRHSFRVVASLLLAAAAIGASQHRDFAAAGGGDLGGNPPLSITTPTTPTNGPTVAPAAGIGHVVVRVYPFTQAPRRAHARVVIRQHGLPVAVGRIPLDVPVVLSIPGGAGVTLDILGTDVLGLPVADGQALRVVMP